MKNCPFALVLCKEFFTLKYKECFLQVRCIKNLFSKVFFNTFYLGNIFRDKNHLSREMQSKILLKFQTYIARNTISARSHKFRPAIQRYFIFFGKLPVANVFFQCIYSLNFIASLQCVILNL